MSRRLGRARVWSVAVSAAGATASIVIACSFPDVTFAPGSEAGGGGDGNAEAAALDGGGGDAPLDAPVADAEQRTDATQRVDEAGCKNPCDCDEDKFVNKSCLEAGADPKTADCDDFDPLRYPTKTAFTTEVPPADNGGDWNCDTIVEPQYPTGLSCTTSCGAEGFTSKPTCGQSADYFRCTGIGLCGATKIDTRKQGCR